MAPSDKDYKPLKQIAKEKQSAAPSQLGDPVSLKAETSDRQPTDQDKSNKSPNKTDEQKSLKDRASEKLKNNPSALGDPVSMKAETSETEPTEHDRGALGTKNAGRNTSGKPKM